MASNDDTSNKGSAKPAAEAPKKPTALIDLKATEVDIKDPKQAAAKAAATVAEAAAKAAATTASARPAGSAPAGAAAGPAGAASAAASTAAPANDKGQAAAAAVTGGGSTSRPASGAGSAIPPMPISSGGGLRGAATHLVAGLAGGLLALVGADALLPKSTPGVVEVASIPPAVETRLRNLEQVAGRPMSPELMQRLAAAEQRLGEFERASRSLSEQQARIAGETQQLNARLAESKPGSGADERVARLEELLTTLSSAASNEPQRGRIPQLAAITGKLTDLESSVATQIAQLRKSVTQEVDSRLAQSADAAQAARAGTQRLDRELAGVKTEAAQIIQRVDGVKAQSDRIEVGLQGLREEASAIKAEMARELRQVARSTDVSTAISPLTSKLSLLEQNVQGVVRGEDDRRANVERIVTALELGNLKRTIERGAAFATELAEVRRVAGPKVDLSVLERFKDRGVPALGELDREFRALAFSIIDADRHPAQAHWTDRLIASAKSVVRVRKVDQGADDTGVEAAVARIELAVKAGRLADAISEAAKLSEPAKVPAKGWLEKVEARANVDRAIGVIEQELKASLGATSQAGKKG